MSRTVDPCAVTVQVELWQTDPHGAVTRALEPPHGSASHALTQSIGRACDTDAVMTTAWSVEGRRQAAATAIVIGAARPAPNPAASARPWLRLGIPLLALPCCLVGLWLARARPQSPVAVAEAAQRASAPEQVTPPTSATKAAVQSALSDEERWALERAAVDALLAGDHGTAVRRYRELALQSADPVFGQMLQLLEVR